MQQQKSFGCRADAEGSTMASYVVALPTEGFYSAGDGGTATYRRAALRPPHLGRLQSADGVWWEICGEEFSVRQFGAMGNGSNDDSKALNAALSCPSVGALHFPAGRYRAIGLVLRRECAISGEAAELFWDVPGDPKYLLHIAARSADVRGLTFSGLRYADIASSVSPNRLFSIDPPEPEDAGDVRLQDLTFIGGCNGCVIGEVSNVFHRPYTLRPLPKSRVGSCARTAAHHCQWTYSYWYRRVRRRENCFRRWSSRYRTVSDKRFRNN